MMLLSKSHLPSREEVLRLCDERGYGLEIPSGFPYNDRVWIKYGYFYKVSNAEAKTQSFVHDNTDPDILYTPKIYDFFSYQSDPKKLEVTFIVMERIYGQRCDEYLKENECHRDRVLQ